MSSYHRLGAGVLCALLVDWKSLRVFVTEFRANLGASFAIQLLVESLSFIEYFHQFLVDFIRIQLSQNMLLVLKLVLRLFRLLSPLLFLNQSVSVFWGTLVLRWALILAYGNVLPMALSSFRNCVDYLLRLVIARWTILSRIKTLLLSHLSVNSIDSLLADLLLARLPLVIQKGII